MRNPQTVLLMHFISHDNGQCLSSGINLERVVAVLASKLFEI